MYADLFRWILSLEERREDKRVGGPTRGSAEEHPESGHHWTLHFGDSLSTPLPGSLLAPLPCMLPFSSNALFT